jgi:hypothetical protein
MFKVGDRVAIGIRGRLGTIKAASMSADVFLVDLDDGGQGPYWEKEIRRVEEAKTPAPEPRFCVGDYVKDQYQPGFGVAIVTAIQAGEFTGRQLPVLSWVGRPSAKSLQPHTNPEWLIPATEREFVQAKASEIAARDQELVEEAKTPAPVQRNTAYEVGDRASLATRMGTAVHERLQEYLDVGVMTPAQYKAKMLDNLKFEVTAMDQELAEMHKAAVARDTETIYEGRRQALALALFRTDPEVLTFVTRVSERPENREATFTKAWERREPEGARERSEERARLVWEEMK